MRLTMLASVAAWTLLNAAAALAAPSAGAAAAPGPLDRLSSSDAKESAAAAEEIVAAGERFIPDIQSAYANLLVGDDAHSRQLRDRYRDVVAGIWAEQVRKRVTDVAPNLGKALDWDGMRRNLTWSPRLATIADALRSLFRVSRLVRDWQEDEASRLVAFCLAVDDATVREAAVWALDREGWKGAAVDLLVGVLKDESEAVRAAAGAVLIARGEQRGLAAVLAGAASADLAVRDQSAAVLPSLIVTEDGRPPRLRFKGSHTAEDVVGLAKLLALEDMESRGMVVRVLGMIGDKSAGPALLGALGKETIAKNRKRIATSLGQLRYRPAAAPLIALLSSHEDKLRSGEGGKNDYGWGVAGAWAQIGDPETVAAMIGLLDDAKLAPYAAAGLSWAFRNGLPGDDQDYSRGDPPGETLVPILASAGRLDRQWTAHAPKGEDLKKLWAGFWSANKGNYKWSDQESTLGRDIRPRPIVWPAAPLPGTKVDGAPLGKHLKGEWVEIPVSVQNTRCNVTGLAVDRANGEVYIVPLLGHLYQIGCGRGVWKSRDRGVTFEKTAQNDTGGGAGCWASMDMDPAGGRLCVFSMYGAVSMTLDGGASWRRFTSISEATTDWGAVDWDDPKAATVVQTNHERSPGQHVSSDGGQTWQPLKAEFSYKAGLGVFDARTILHIERDEILRSEDLGRTWTSVAKENLRTIVMRKYAGVGYLIGEKGLLVSADKGKTWTVRGSPIGDPSVFAGPYFGKDENHVLAVGKAGIHESLDGGKTWKAAIPLPGSFTDKALARVSMNPNYIEGTSLGYDPKADIFYVSLSGFPLFYRYER